MSAASPVASSSGLRHRLVPRRTLVATVALSALIGSTAGAHDQPFSYAHLDLTPSGLELRLSVHAADAASALGSEASGALLDPRAGADARRRLGVVLARRFAVDADGRSVALALTAEGLRTDRPGVVLEYRGAWRRMPGQVRFHARLFPEDAQHETFLNVYERGRLRRQDVLDAERTEARIYTNGAQGLMAVTLTFLAAGIHHIFIGPDHILFVIGLLLLGGGLLRILKIVTAFTLAHSVTLALAAFQLVNPPARIIEPLIALSIVIVGIQNLRARPGGRDARAAIAFGFGFVHGFGFASMLREFGLPREALTASLFAFNGGVEIGQACIVLAVVPALALLRARAPELAPRVVLAGSLGVVLAGSFWLAQRALFAG